jgi:hypothetical protein
MAKSYLISHSTFSVIVLAILWPAPIAAQESVSAHLKSSLIFHVPFDGTLDARVATGSKRIFTGDSSDRKEVQEGNHRKDVMLAPGMGRFGDALRFSDNSQEVVFYDGANMGFRQENWSGSVSFWLKLDPDKDLKPGFCDPIQITQKQWNDAALFVDFDRELPRDFRLGVFADYKFWNPTDIDWEELPVADRPMVVVKKPPFSTDEWTHVAFTFENYNAAESNTASKSTLYLNGKPSGSLVKPMQFHWDKENTAIMLGLLYIGDFDDLTVFSKALTPTEIQHLYQLPGGGSDL